MRSELESTEDVTVSYEAARPRRRDFLRVLLGRWTPEIRRIERLTLAGVNHELKDAWNDANLERQLLDDTPLFGMVDIVRDDGTIAEYGRVVRFDRHGRPLAP